MPAFGKRRRSGIAADFLGGKRVVCLYWLSVTERCGFVLFRDRMRLSDLLFTFAKARAILKKIQHEFAPE